VAIGSADAARPGREIPAAVRWPRLRAALWRMPVGDGACATIGSGCCDGARIALSIGTSAALRVLLTGGYTPPPPGLWSYRLDRERTLLGGAISNGGVVRTWLRSLLRLPENAAELDTLLAARPPAAHGISMLPFLSGERSPHWPLDAAASLSGLRLATSALDVLQAAMEAVAYRLAILRRILRDPLPDATEIVAGGGALRASPYWAQIIADVLGEPLLLSGDAETSSRGAAMLALEAAGIPDALRTIAPSGAAISPDGHRHALHAAALELHTRLEARLR
jgi:gluconokinase